MKYYDSHKQYQITGALKVELEDLADSANEYWKAAIDVSKTVRDLLELNSEAELQARDEHGRLQLATTFSGAKRSPNLKNNSGIKRSTKKGKEAFLVISKFNAGMPSIPQALSKLGASVFCEGWTMYTPSLWLPNRGPYAGLAFIHTVGPEDCIDHMDAELLPLMDWVRIVLEQSAQTLSEEQE